MNTDGSIMCFEEFIKKYGSVNTNFIQYLGIKRAIDFYINKLHIKNRKDVNHIQLDIPFLYKILFKSTKGSRDFYKTLISKESKVKVKKSETLLTRDLKTGKCYIKYLLIPVKTQSCNGFNIE